MSEKSGPNAPSDREKLNAIRLLHSPGNYETISNAVNPCCMVCDHSEGWPCRTRQEIDR